MKEKDLIINVDFSLDEELAADTISVYPKLENFSQSDPLRHRFTPSDYCGGSAQSSIKIDACKISDNKDIEAELDCQGRLLTIKVTLKNVCPNKKIAVGVLLLEGNTVKGFKAKEIVTPSLLNSRECNHCDSVVVCKFCFVLPGSLCCPITLTPKVIAHYTNFNVDLC